VVPARSSASLRYGASDGLHVVGGLALRPLAEVCAGVAVMGFTVVRLPFSNEMLRLDAACLAPGQQGSHAIDFDLNPSLRGKTPLEVLDAVVDGLGAAKVAVVLNNHTTLGMWSGGVEANGLWFLEKDAAAEAAAAATVAASPRDKVTGGGKASGGGGGDAGNSAHLGGGGYTEARWVADWVTLARRYSDRPWVVGYDLRNEVRESSCDHIDQAKQGNAAS
jgi:hypothetical protein